MFEVVVSTRPSHRVWQRPDALASSVVVHGLVMYALLTAPGRPLPAPIDFEREMATFLDVLSQPPQPDAPPKGEGTGPGAPSAPVAVVPAPPPSSIALADIPLDLPEVETILPSASALEVVSVEAFGNFEGSAGLGNGKAPEDVEDRLNGAAGGPIVTEGRLAERPRVLNRFEMEQLWQRLYPPLLNMKGIPGDAIVSFVINVDGRVDPATIRMVSTSHPEFIVATIAGVKKLRFRPAHLNGSPVRVRAVMPVHWRPQEI